MERAEVTALRPRYSGSARERRVWRRAAYERLANEASEWQSANWHRVENNHLVVVNYANEHLGGWLSLDELEDRATAASFALERRVALARSFALLAGCLAALGVCAGALVTHLVSVIYGALVAAVFAVLAAVAKQVLGDVEAERSIEWRKVASELARRLGGGARPQP